MVKVKKELLSEAQHVVDAANKRANSYNIVFRQLSANLIIASGILLALSTQITSELQGSNLFLRILVAGIVISLTLSIAFGVVQQLIEAEYFRKGAMKRLIVLDDMATGKLSNPDKIDGKLEAIDDEMGKAVTRWASFVQLALLAIALALIIVAVTAFLFA